jgi:hypothetical protein
MPKLKSLYNKDLNSCHISTNYYPFLIADNTAKYLEWNVQVQQPPENKY